MEVTLYTTHCPQCEVLKKKLDQKGVQYNIVEDQDAMIEKGFMSAPILEVDGTALAFKQAVDWLSERSA